MPDLSSADIALLSIATLFTSGFAAVLGQGGGLMLFALLAIYIQPPLLIALHAVIQMFSNSSRAALALPHINWGIILPIILGTLVGAALITPAVEQTNWQWMQPIMGLYILYLIWGAAISMPFTLPAPMFSTGLLQGSLGMVLGATGPLANALLLSKGLNKNAIVASNAVIMSISHMSKIVLFGLLGITLWEHLSLLITLSCAAILGSYLGSHIRGRLSEPVFTNLFKGLLTLLALRMVLSHLIEL